MKPINRTLAVSLVFFCFFRTMSFAGTLDGNVEKHLSVELPIQVFTFDGSKDQTIIGLQGTEIEFPANCFENYYGFDTTKVGLTITIRIQEANDKASLVESGLSPKVGSTALEVLGGVFISASSGDHVLKLKTNVHAKIHFPQKSTVAANEWTVFNLHPNENSSMKWVETSAIDYYLSDDGVEMLTKPVANSKILDEQQRQTVLIDEFGWTCCGRLFPTDYETQVDFWADCNSKDSTLSIRLVLADYFIVIAPNYRSENGAASFDNVPKNAKATLVCFMQQGDQVLFASQAMSTGEKYNMDMELKLMSIEEFQRMLQQLNTH